MQMLKLYHIKTAGKCPVHHVPSSVGFVNSVHGYMGPASECVRQVFCSACEVGSAEFTPGVQLSHHSSSTCSF